AGTRKSEVSSSASSDSSASKAGVSRNLAPAAPVVATPEEAGTARIKTAPPSAPTSEKLPPSESASRDEAATVFENLMGFSTSRRLNQATTPDAATSRRDLFAPSSPRCAAPSTRNGQCHR